MKASVRYEQNRREFLAALRSGRYKKGTLKSDSKGNPVINSKEDNEGYCACAVMSHLFGQMPNKEKLSVSKATKALGISTSDCKYIQSVLNDSPLTFWEIADRIETDVFNK